MSQTTQSFSWEEWRLWGQGYAWSTRYTASSVITVTRNIGSDTATVKVDTTMTTPSGDSSLGDWQCIISINGASSGGGEKTFTVASAGYHAERSSFTATQTYTVNVGVSAGTLSGQIKMRIGGYSGYQGEYSEAKAWSLTYDTKGTPSQATWSNAYFGNASTITIQRTVPDFRESVYLVWQDDTSHPVTIRTYSQSSATTISYTIPYNALPTTAQTRSAKIRVVSYNGSTQIGTWETSAVTVTVKSGDTTYLPTLSANPVAEAYNDVVSALGTDTAVAQYSKINVKANKSDVSLKYSATIVSRVVTFSNGSSAATDQTNHISSLIQSAGDVTWTYTVTDSRGFKVTRTGTYTVINSSAPSITSVTVYRGDSTGTAVDGGAYIYATATATCESLNGHNSVTLQGKVDSGSWQSMTNNTRKTLKSDADANTQYVVTLKTTDLLRSTEQTYIVASASLPLHITPDKKGIGIGTKGTSGSVTVGLDAKFKRSVTIENVNPSIKYQGTKATYPMIKFKDNTADANGNGIVIGGGGLTIVGGGESADTALAQYSTGGSEALELVNDGAVNIRSNLQNGWGSRKDFIFNTSGYIETPLGVDKVYGRYTANGGQQPPNYFGKNTVGFLMSNVTVNGDSHYKNIMYMDCYNGSDVGGVSALALDRQEARAFILQSDANRTSWNNSTELVTHAQTSTSNTANTVVKRDGSGYIRAVYYNASCGVENGSYSTASNLMFANSDGWLRKVGFNSATIVTAVTSKASNVVIDEGSYARFGRIIVVNIRIHATASTSTRTYFANLPTPVAPVGVLGINYSTGQSAGTYYYLGTNGQGLSNLGSMSTTSHCICFSYISAS